MTFNYYVIHLSISDKLIPMKNATRAWLLIPRLILCLEIFNVKSRRWSIMFVTYSLLSFSERTQGHGICTQYLLQNYPSDFPKYLNWGPWHTDIAKNNWSLIHVYITCGSKPAQSYPPVSMLFSFSGERPKNSLPQGNGSFVWDIVDSCWLMPTIKDNSPFRLRFLWITL